MSVCSDDVQPARPGAGPGSCALRVPVPAPALFRASVYIYRLDETYAVMMYILYSLHPCPVAVHRRSTWCDAQVNAQAEVRRV